MRMNKENYNKIGRLILDIAESQKELKRLVDEDIRIRKDIKKFKKTLNSYPKKDIKIVMGDMFN